MIRSETKTKTHSENDMLLLPRLKNAETKECSAHRNIHIKIYACLLYETKDKISLAKIFLRCVSKFVSNLKLPNTKLCYSR